MSSKGTPKGENVPWRQRGRTLSLNDNAEASEMLALVLVKFRWKGSGGVQQAGGLVLDWTSIDGECRPGDQ